MWLGITCLLETLSKFNRKSRNNRAPCLTSPATLCLSAPKLTHGQKWRSHISKNFSYSPSRPFILWLGFVICVLFMQCQYSVVWLPNKWTHVILGCIELTSPFHVCPFLGPSGPHLVHFAPEVSNPIAVGP